jgi:hypothetical protein
MGCCDKKKPIFVGTLILVAITLITAPTKSTVAQSSQSNPKIDIATHHLNGIGTLEQNDQKTLLWVNALVHEPQKETLKIGQNAIVTFRSTGKQHYMGIIRRINAVNAYLPEEKMVSITLDTLPKTLATGEQAEVIINLP